MAVELRDDSDSGSDLSCPGSPSPSSPTPSHSRSSNNNSKRGQGIVDHTTFDQLVDMDDEDEFSRNLVHNYFEQAQRAFGDMDAAMSSSDLVALSRLGHFLKGSSAQLGLLKVKASCEKLQYYGQGMDAAGQHTHISDEEAEKQIKILLIQMRREYEEAETYLRYFYGELPLPESPPQE
ncbi:MAG: signal transduction histidine kinase [Linnemannia gamsii]|nr:MAG: signal transduction histidine kinase [Linnemannia gamsii]